MDISRSSDCNDPVVSAYADRDLMEDLLDSSSDEEDDDIDSDRLYHGIYISTDNATVINITLTLDELPAILQCEITDARSVSTRVRSLIIFCDDMGLTKDLPINSHASALTMTSIHGPVVIIDEHADLSASDLF